MPCVLYNKDYREVWDQTVRASRNATFLFERDFMDYHQDRFTDASLLFFNEKGKCIALLPANIKKENHEIQSHGGLTYGGLLLTKEVHTPQVQEMLIEAANIYEEMGATTWSYKPIPYIYHRYPTQEDLYWLFRMKATLAARAVSTVIDLQDPLPFSTLRKRKVKKAQNSGFTITEGGDQHWKDYWQILTDVLQQQHDTRPVHTLQEIQLLANRFPKQIRLFTILEGNTCLAGCVVFDMDPTVHIQYIAANPEGKEKGALDLLFHQLIEQATRQGRHYFDFGISTEEGGQILNEGLLFQKEGFGGRAVCYDNYIIPLKSLAR